MAQPCESHSGVYYIEKSGNDGERVENNLCKFVHFNLIFSPVIIYHFFFKELLLGRRGVQYIYI